MTTPPTSWKLELVAVPVTDVDRAKAFYVDQVGFVADHDHRVSETLRFVQLTPPGSACSIVMGEGITDDGAWVADAAPDRGLRRRRGARRARRRGVEVSEVEDSRGGSFVFFSDPDGNGWALQLQWSSSS